ncbi:unnamed protein product [Leptosia nina]|uniref:Uncharacterized protein n=1 Tax=Leptosia nina TaxID=320188 RepID=A0AAV1JWG0_9NEOP
MCCRGVTGILRAKFTAFCKQCTLHGFCYLSVGVHRTVWGFVIVASLCLCATLGAMIWNKFVEDPTFTVVESAHYPTENIPFAAVAVCDAHIYGPATSNVSNILTLRGFNTTQIQNFYSSFTRIKSKKYSPEAHVLQIHSVLEDLGFTYYDLTHQFRKPCEELIKECSWREMPLNCTMMFREVFTYYGHCCQFDMEYFKKFAENETNLTAGVDKSEALDIIVDSKRVLPNGAVQNGYVELFVFDQNHRLTFLDGPINLTPATYFDVTVELWVIEASSDVRRLSLRSRKCFLDSDEVNIDSYQSCISRWVMKEIVAKCRCLPFDYGDKVQGAIRSILTERECYQKCDYVQYETEVEYTRPQRRRGVESRNTENRGLSRVAVHYANNICIKYRREVLYTWDQMLGQCRPLKSSR